VTPADTQAALDAATATLAAGGIPRASLHARDVLALVACVSALRDVLAQTERERDEARRVLRWHDAWDALRPSTADFTNAAERDEQRARSRPTRVVAPDARPATAPRDAAVLIGCLCLTFGVERARPPRSTGHASSAPE
jgi:hypothetical protein